MKKVIFFNLLFLVVILTFAGCFGSGGGSSGSLENFNSLSNLPDFSEVIGSGSVGSSGLWSNGVVNGTPPAFKDIQSSQVETYFTGSVDSIINVIQDPGSSSEDIENALSNFFTGMAKCEIAQGAAEQLQHLNEATTSICYMSKFPKQAGIENSLEYVAGEQLVDLSTLMDQSEATRTLKMNISEPPGEGEMGQMFIYFTFTGSNDLPNNYRAKLDFCNEIQGSFVHTGSELIDLNRSSGSLVLTHLGQDSWENGSGSFNSTFTAGVQEISEDEYDWVGDRTMAVQGSFTGSFNVPEIGNFSYTDAFNGSLVASDSGSDTLLTGKFFHQNTFTEGENNFSSQGKGYAKVLGNGASFSDFAVLMGAGRHQWQHNQDTHEGSIAFEYDESLSPRYNTTNLAFSQNVTVDDLYNDVVSLDFSSDALLGQAQPTAPNTSELNFDCANPPSADAEYNFNMGTQAALQVVDQCEQYFRHGRNLCQELRQYEEAVFQALYSSP